MRIVTEWRGKRLERRCEAALAIIWEMNGTDSGIGYDVILLDKHITDTPTPQRERRCEKCLKRGVFSGFGTNHMPFLFQP